MIRRNSRLVPVLATALVVVVATVGVTTVAGAQGRIATPFAPWIGCWDLVPRGNAVASNERVCVVPTEGAEAVDLVSIAGDSILTRQRLDATADKRAVQQGDCKGVESVQAMGARVYLRTDLQCGDQHRLVNSVMAMSGDGEWIDVRGVAFGSNVGVRASRYHETPASARIPASIAAALNGHPRSLHAARLAASGPVQLADVVEASRHLEIGVLQTWLAERAQGFGIDARQLVTLESAGVAPSVIDVMVALSYPDVFALDRTQLGDPPPDTRGELRGEGYGYDDVGYYGRGYGWGYDPYGYGYGRGYGWYSGRRPIVVVQRPAGSNTDEHGRVVKGRGYVAPRGSTGSSSSDGRSAGRTGSSDTEKQGSSTGRKAKPKPGL
ncbi:MAG: hypothetical protein IT359_17405 [Gemmatimonadaceae bacterium]|nr:hypothetical protein [Gemmatimonadaceae bacterium]